MLRQEAAESHISDKLGSEATACRVLRQSRGSNGRLVG